MPSITTTSYTYTQFVDRINAIKINNGDIAQHDRIKVCDDFQRGDDDTGVWNLKMKQELIDSLINGCPVGITMLVKPQGATYNTPWSILDGGNRARCVRDFFNNKFKTKDKRIFNELCPEIKANLKNSHIYLHYITISREDPDDIIATLFTRINTKIVPLKEGELIKAHGWQRNIPIIELAKKIIGGPWTNNQEKTDNDEADEDIDDKDIDDEERVDKVCRFLRKKWHNIFPGGGPECDIRETKRCDNIALACGFIVSSIQNSIPLFTTKFNTLKKYLIKDHSPPRDKLINLFNRISLLLDIVKDINNPKIMFKPQCGFPRQILIFSIWGAIIKNKMNDIFKRKTIKFYNKIQEDDILYNRYHNCLTYTGDTHTTSSKLKRVSNLINKM